MGRRAIPKSPRPAILLVTLLGVFIAPAFAQNPPSSLAQQIVTQIAKLRALSKKNSSPKFRIAVIPFARDGKKTTQVGAELAQQLTAEIAAAAPELEFVSKEEVDRALNHERIWPTSLDDDATAQWFGKKMNLDLVLTGTFKPKENGAELIVKGVPCRKNETAFRRWADYTGNEQFRRRLVEDKALSPWEEPEVPAGVFQAGVGGISEPACLSCPDPEYTNEARAAKLKFGFVLLRVIVTAEGHAANITVIRALPYGLTNSAINAVHGWKFKPALGPDGKPVPVWATVEVTFRLL